MQILTGGLVSITPTKGALAVGVASFMLGVAEVVYLDY